MKNKYLLVIILVLSIIAIISSPKKETANFLDEEKQDDEIKLTIKDSKTNDEIKLNLEDYIVGVVAGEMPASFSEEALKAQAIAARTYAVYKMGTANKTYDLTTDVSNQVYINDEEMHQLWKESYQKYFDKVKKAVEDTTGLIMNYDGKVISSFYFAISNGKTEDVAQVFGQSKDYLKSVDSSWDKEVKSFNKIVTFSKEEFCQKLAINCEKIIIKDIKKSSSGRVNSININDKEFKGTKIRSLLNLRSTDFEIKVNNLVEISTNGYGHGVGMSQYGANEMAKRGSNYEEILKHYYQNIEIEKIAYKS